MIGQPGDANNPGTSTPPGLVAVYNPQTLSTQMRPVIDPLNQPFTRRDMIDLLTAQLGYPGCPQRVIDAMIGKWSKQ